VRRHETITEPWTTGNRTFTVPGSGRPPGGHHTGATGRRLDAVGMCAAVPTGAACDGP